MTSFVGWRPWELLSGGLDSRILSWDFNKGRPTTALDMAEGLEQSGNQMLNPPFVHGLTLAATGKKEHGLVAALGDGRLYWHYLSSGGVVPHWVEGAHSSAVSCVAASDTAATPGLVASGGNDGLVKLWQLPPSDAEAVAEGGAATVGAVRVLGNKSKVQALALSEAAGRLYIADQTSTIKAIPLAQ